MNKLKLICFGLVLTTMAFASDPYKYVIDLTKVSNDKVFVELDPPKIKERDILFYLPKIVPGTYAIADYGRMVSDFKAYDKKGRELKVKRLDDNSWRISKAKKLEKITYWVEDTYDTEKEGPEIFQPAGTNIEDAKNYLINTGGFFGYFEGMKKEEFQLNFIRSKDMYGATGLKAESIGTTLSASLQKEGFVTADQNSTVDQFLVSDYDRLVDSPLMYSTPDTALVKVANTEVLVASYSPNKMVTAKEIAASISEVLEAQRKFLGNQLPVDKYAFIFYFTDQPVISYGALEHSYSSLYFMPEQPIGVMKQQLRDFAAHEFFHIVTPLTIHSDEIENFDFNNPKMSEHLWMYEGMTEYFAGLVQVKYGLISKEQYLNELLQKIMTASEFKDDLPFTELSKGTLDIYADQYYNVYMKGALIGMALDIKLRKLSNGAYGVQDMMKDLSQKYGKNAAFHDDDLFGVITEMTYPEIGEFFKTYVYGNTPLPYAEIFEEVGVNLQDNGKRKTFTLGLGQGNINAEVYKDKQYIKIQNEGSMDEMGKALGFKNGDLLTKLQGENFPELGPELGSFIGKYVQQLPLTDSLSFTVLRENEAGKKEEVELSAKVRQVEVAMPPSISFDPNATQEQLQLRNQWLEIKK